MCVLRCLSVVSIPSYAFLLCIVKNERERSGERRVESEEEGDDSEYVSIQQILLSTYLHHHSQLNYYHHISYHSFPNQRIA